MGGSLAASCRKRFPYARIVGISRSQKAILTALKNKWVDEATKDVSLGAAGADIVILCMPVGTFLPYLKEIDLAVCRKVLVTDVGSVKGSVLREVNSVDWKNISFVGAHPMAGSDKQGIDLANASLYDNALIVLTKDAKTSPKAYAEIKKFWQKISPRIFETTPATHDKLVAEISHLPHAAAASLVRIVSGNALKIASSGFCDTTRVAASSPNIWTPIFLANRKEVLKSLELFERGLDDFKKILRSGDMKKLTAFLEKSRQKRQKI